MNTAKLARVTFVLDLETRDQLAFVCKRMGVSQSALARDILTEPVALMAKWVRDTPAEPTAADASLIGDVIQGDLIDFIERRTAQLAPKGDA